MAKQLHMSAAKVAQFDEAFLDYATIPDSDIEKITAGIAKIGTASNAQATLAVVGCLEDDN